MSIGFTLNGKRISLTSNSDTEYDVKETQRSYVRAFLSLLAVLYDRERVEELAIHAATQVDRHPRWEVKTTEFRGKDVTVTVPIFNDDVAAAWLAKRAQVTAK